MPDPQPTLTRPLVLIGVVAILGLAAWWWMSGPLDPPPPASDPGSGDAEVGASGGQAFEEPEVLDPDSTRRDGGARLEVADETHAVASPGAYDPPLPTLGVEEPMHRVDPDAPSVQPPPSRNTAPTTPEQALGRAVFWRGMLDRRMAELNQQLERATELGDDPAVARARRMLERLEAQRPSIDQRVEELEEQASGIDPPDEP